MLHAVNENAALFLAWLGFADAKSLSGGMAAWPGPRESG